MRAEQGVLAAQRRVQQLLEQGSNAGRAPSWLSRWFRQDPALRQARRELATAQREYRNQLNYVERAGTAAATGTGFTTLGGGRVGPEFNPQQLQHILRNLERRGVVIDTGPDALRLLEREGARALYMAGNGRPGVLILRPGATRLEVMEELIHHGQHVRAGFWLPTNSAELALIRVHREIEAQDILLRLARNRNWSAEEIARITANREVWVQELERLTGR